MAPFVIQKLSGQRQVDASRNKCPENIIEACCKTYDVLNNVLPVHVVT